MANPVRVYKDFASLDLISRGRAEVIVGRSAFVEPFALFGYDTADYEALFAEKLGLLLDIRGREEVTWAGRFRPPLRKAAVVPRAVQQPLPVWVGVGGSPDSAERAGGLGLPMVLGYIGGTLGHLRPLVDAYRAAGERAGHPGPAQGGPLHPLPRGRRPGQGARRVPLLPGRHGAIMIGSAGEITDKLLDAAKALDLDRIFAQVDWGGLPPEPGRGVHRPLRHRDRSRPPPLATAMPSARPRRRRRRHECSRNCARRRQPRKIFNRQLNRELSGALWFREGWHPDALAARAVGP